MKQFVDQNRSHREFHVGDQVYLKLQQYAQTSLVKWPLPKLSYKFYGPFKVLAKIGAAAYKLELPEGSLVHPVFHVSQLKQHIQDHTPVFSSLPVVEDLSVSDTVPEAIRDRRPVKKGNVAHLQVLIKWASLRDSFLTWEDYAVLKKRFPNAPAWGQVGSEGDDSFATTLAAMGYTPSERRTRKKRSKKAESE